MELFIIFFVVWDATGRTKHQTGLHGLLLVLLPHVSKMWSGTFALHGVDSQLPRARTLQWQLALPSGLHLGQLPSRL